MKAICSKVMVTFFLCLVFMEYSVAQTVDSTMTKKEKKALKKKTAPQKGDVYFSPLPVIGANPAFGFIYGVGAATSGYLGDPKSTSISSALLGLAFTTKSQTIFTIKSNIYSENNNFVLLGDWRYLDSSQPTWGLGTGPQSAKLVSSGFEYDDGSLTNGIDTPQMLEFKFFRFYQTALKKVAINFYAGVGIHVDLFSDFNDQLLDINATPPLITSFYAYNEKYGFNQDNVRYDQ